jgi:hypothetical protein
LNQRISKTHVEQFRADVCRTHLGSCSLAWGPVTISFAFCLTHPCSTIYHASPVFEETSRLPSTHPHIPHGIKSSPPLHCGARLRSRTTLSPPPQRPSHQRVRAWQQGGSCILISAPLPSFCVALPPPTVFVLVQQPLGDTRCSLPLSKSGAFVFLWRSNVSSTRGSSPHLLYLAGFVRAGSHTALLWAMLWCSTTFGALRHVTSRFYSCCCFL